MKKKNESHVGLLRFSIILEIFQKFRELSPLTKYSFWVKVERGYWRHSRPSLATLFVEFCPIAHILDVVFMEVFIIAPQILLTQSRPRHTKLCTNNFVQFF